MNVWIVGKANPKNVKEWDFQGVFSSEALAVDACINRDFFVGKASMDVALPIESISWPGAYYPKSD